MHFRTCPFLFFSTCRFVELETRGKLGNFGEDHVARGESSANPNPTTFVVHVHVFVDLGPPLKN